VSRPDGNDSAAAFKGLGVPEGRISFVSVSDLPGLRLMQVQDSARRFRVFHESYDVYQKN
jgi:hypothetical protein